MGGAISGEGCLSFIQVTMVAGESVEIQVRVRFSSSWVRDMIFGGSVWESERSLLR